MFEHTFIEYLLMYCHADGARNFSLGTRTPLIHGIAVGEKSKAERAEKRAQV
jgi:hypothetical protein